MILLLIKYEAIMQRFQKSKSTQSTETQQKDKKDLPPGFLQKAIWNEVFACPVAPCMSPTGEWLAHRVQDGIKISDCAGKEINELLFKEEDYISHVRWHNPNVVVFVKDNKTIMTWNIQKKQNYLWKSSLPPQEVGILTDNLRNKIKRYGVQPDFNYVGPCPDGSVISVHEGGTVLKWACEKKSDNDEPKMLGTWGYLKNYCEMLNDKQLICLSDSGQDSLHAYMFILDLQNEKIIKEEKYTNFCPGKISVLNDQDIMVFGRWFYKVNFRNDMVFDAEKGMIGACRLPKNLYAVLQINHIDSHLGYYALSIYDRHHNSIARVPIPCSIVGDRYHISFNPKSMRFLFKIEQSVIDIDIGLQNYFKYTEEVAKIVTERQGPDIGGITLSYLYQR